MKQEEAEKLLEKVSENVLETIKNMIGKNPRNRVIGADSLALVLRIKTHDLNLVIEHLEKKGEIIVFDNSSNSNRPNKASGISLPDS